MKMKLQVVIESECGKPEDVQEIAVLERGVLRPDSLGLTLAEAKHLLHGVQQSMITQQVTHHVATQGPCSACGNQRGRKGQHVIQFRTLFGTVKLESPRYYVCRCQNPPSRLSVSPLAELLRERTAPELAYLQAKFVALVSYGVTAEFLAEVFPIGRAISTGSLHRNLEHIAGRLEGELGEKQEFFIDGCQQDCARLPRPQPPLTVGLDGAYVHAHEQRSRTEGWFEIIAGKSVPAEGPSRRVAFVTTYDTKPRRRLYEVLKSQGLQVNQPVIFLSDGGDTVREVPRYLSPESEHWLDWFHITMRLTVMGQMLKGVAAEIQTTPCHEEDAPSGEDVQDLQRNLERLKWYLWHGNVYQALHVLEEMDDVVATTAEHVKSAKKLLKAVAEFEQYIETNRHFIPNFGDRYRHGETISTAFVESTINQVVSKRMVKRQQMRWSQRGAHLLLQVRTRTLDGVLRDDFVRWYPGMAMMDGMRVDPRQKAA